MNERIKELAEQFKTNFSIDEYSQFGIHWDNVDEFAELIVRECQLRVQQYINNCGEIASIPDTVIMKHFGVEK